MAYINARRSLATLLTRTLSSSASHPPSCSSSLSSRSRYALALLNKSPVFISDTHKILTRTKTSGSGYSPLNDPSPNWSNRPPKETILLDGCDYEHWLIVLEFPEKTKPSEEEMVDAYVKTLASVVGRLKKTQIFIISLGFLFLSFSNLTIGFSFDVVVKRKLRRGYTLFARRGIQDLVLWSLRSCLLKLKVFEFHLLGFRVFYGIKN